MKYNHVVMFSIPLFIFVFGFGQIHASLPEGECWSKQDIQNLLTLIRKGKEDCKRTGEMLSAIDLGPAGNARMAEFDQLLSECFPDS